MTVTAANSNAAMVVDRDFMHTPAAASADGGTDRIPRTFAGMRSNTIAAPRVDRCAERTVAVDRDRLAAIDRSGS
jgi:hypothetical protein